RKVHVAEAQRVEAGAVLVELDDTKLRADLEALKARYYGGLALEARLKAERRRDGTIEFPPELVAAAQQDVHALRNMSLQQQLFTSRRAALQAELHANDEAIASLSAQRSGLLARLGGRRSQLALLDEQLRGSRGLAADGYLPRNRLLEEERMRADLLSQIVELEASAAARLSDIAELRMRSQVKQREFLQNVDAEM